VTRGRAGWIAAILLLGALVTPGPRAQGLIGQPVSCVVPVSTATTITAVGGDCAAKPGFRLFVTDIHFSTNAAGIAADSFPTLKYGTGTTCGTGTTIFWGAFSPAATQNVIYAQLATPILLPVNVDVCWIDSSAGSKFLVLTGYVKP
jgi:hypothetical protein